MLDVDSAAFFARVQASGAGTAISQSLLLTAGLSALHLVGFTLLMGSALVVNLRLAGVLFRDRPLLEIAGPANRGIAAGLAVSVLTGLLLFTGRAATAYGNGTFQIKMLLLLAAATSHFAWQRRCVRRAASPTPPPLLRATGAVGLILWLSVALAGCAYILLE